MPTWSHFLPTEQLQMFMAKVPQLVIRQVTPKSGDVGYWVPCLIPQELCKAPLGVGQVLSFTVAL